ncbi:sigma-54-dependent transcriptional regulator [Rubrivirga litoralis]|uniref:Sigma-54 dependent transcriptional regulator n=1 Tax=Rubrivirga litoralis TaxID=3075598 RepID=A0ABU3BP79_9BACT|nr:sigma-54 dependent transcriptional regulator [Rubrivirga sp. F394]MDT0631094.1 sigma-54 dependent transcriptional regulator [Rubrivirga sp. F394]
MTTRFFVVDDDRHYARLLSYRIDKAKDHEVHVFHSGEDALDALDRVRPDLVLLDIMMPGLGGMETLRRLQLFEPDLPVVMISAQGTADVAVEAMKGGATDYITKGQDDLVKLDTVVKRLKDRVRLAREVEQLRAEVAKKYGMEEIVGDSPAMERVYQLVQKTLRGNLTVAVQGESGTGKELVARAIHFNADPLPGKPERGPFVVVNSAAIPAELMESEFFGHEKGSFTGAHARHIGKFEQADGGTLFLDEVGELDLGLQAKLLRALQNREITRVGGAGTITFECRVISATNKDVLEMVRKGTFREDLYYRLFQFPIALPPLRARGNDVLLLAQGFLEDYVEAYPRFKGKRLSGAAVRAILDYGWPGNVRELKSTVERAVLIADGDEIEEEDLLINGPNAIRPWAERAGAAPVAAPPAPAAPPAVPSPAPAPAEPAAPPAPSGDGQGGPGDFPPLAGFATPPPAEVYGRGGAEQGVPQAHSSATPQDAPQAQPGGGVDGIAALAPDDLIVPLDDLKRQAVERAFAICEGNVERAAGELGIGRATLYRLLKKYDISTE